MEADLKLWRILGDCADLELPFPSNTRHIKCGVPLTWKLAQQVLAVDAHPMPKELVWRAFGGQPVKQVFAVVHGTALKIPDLIERDSYLRLRAQRRIERGEIAA
jgi:hypothetical protein